MRGIQIVLAAAVLCGTAFVLGRRSRLAVNLAVVAFAMAALTMIGVPSTADWLASMLDVARGADVVIYFMLLFLCFGWALLYAKLRLQQAQLVELTRSIAIAGAQQPEIPKRLETRTIRLPRVLQRAS